MRKIPYTDLEIYQDPRMLVIRKILPTIVSKTDMLQSIVTIMPDNNMIIIDQLSIVLSCNLKECIPGYNMYIDPRSFDENIMEAYKIQEDEYIKFNQNSSSIYLNIDVANQSYFYNINNYRLIDKIEDISSYEDFQYYINLKSDDGSKFFKGYNDKFIIPIFTKFPNIAKSDTASLYVYEYDKESNLVVWKIYKKKLNRDLYTIFRVLKL